MKGVMLVDMTRISLSKNNSEGHEDRPVCLTAQQISIYPEHESLQLQ